MVYLRTSYKKTHVTRLGFVSPGAMGMHTVRYMNGDVDVAMFDTSPAAADHDSS